MLTALRAYKLLISPWFRGSCRFLPSCADYAAEAVQRYGVLGGGRLAARRLARCHPLCTAGHDPVPDVEQDCVAQDFSPAATAGLKTCTTAAPMAGLKTCATGVADRITN